MWWTANCHSLSCRSFRGTKSLALWPRRAKRPGGFKWATVLACRGWAGPAAGAGEVTTPQGVTDGLHRTPPGAIIGERSHGARRASLDVEWPSRSAQCRRAVLSLPRWKPTAATGRCSGKTGPVTHWADGPAASSVGGHRPLRPSAEGPNGVGFYAGSPATTQPANQCRPRQVSDHRSEAAPLVGLGLHRHKALDPFQGKVGERRGREGARRFGRRADEAARGRAPRAGLPD